MRCGGSGSTCAMYSRSAIRTLACNGAWPVTVISLRSPVTSLAAPAMNCAGGIAARKQSAK